MKGLMDQKGPYIEEKEIYEWYELSQSNLLFHIQLFMGRWEKCLNYGTDYDKTLQQHLK